MLTVIFALVAGISAHRYHSWLAPAPIWNLCWAAMFLSTATLGSIFDHYTEATWVLAGMAMLYNLPGFAFAVPKPVDTLNRSPLFNPPLWLIRAMILVGLLGAIRVGSELGNSVLSIRSLGELFSLGQANAVAIFRGEAAFSTVVNVAFAGLQLGMAMAGWRLAVSPDRAVKVCIGLLFVDAFLWSSITTQRSYLLVPLVWLAAGYLSALVGQGKRAVSGKALGIAIASFVSLAVLVVFLRAVRISGGGAGLSSDGFSSARLWAGGYVPTFGSWYDSSDVRLFGERIPDDGLLRGVRALVESAIGGGAGATETEGGGYFDVGGGFISNAGTSIKTVIGEGGIVWGALMILALGTIAHATYVRAHRGGSMAVAAYAGTLAFTLWATNAWFFGYGGRVIALAALIFFAARLDPARAKRQPGKRSPTTSIKRQEPTSRATL